MGRSVYLLGLNRLHERKLARRQQQAAAEAALREAELYDAQLLSGAASLASMGSCYSSKTLGGGKAGGPLERRATAEIRVEVPRLREAVAPPFGLPPHKDSPIPSPGQAPPHNP